MYLCVLVVRECPRLCGTGRDRLLSLERELAQFVRVLLKLVVPARVVPAEFDVVGLLTPVTEGAGSIDDVEYTRLFGHYFRFTLAAQKPYFFKSVQNFLLSLVTSMTSELRSGWPDQLSFIAFDATIIYAGSEDRRIDSLLGTCAVLRHHGLLDAGDGSAVLQEYQEICNYFKQRWSVLSQLLPVIDDLYSMWFSYPYWSRCQHFQSVLEAVVGLTAFPTYNLDFSDSGVTAMDHDVLISSYHFARSLFNGYFTGHTRQSLVGFMEVSKQTDMQVSRLSDRARVQPWDQLLKVGLGEMLARCHEACNADVIPIGPGMMDNYRSEVLDQLGRDSTGMCSPVRKSVRRSCKKSPSVKTPVKSSCVSVGSLGEKRKPGAKVQSDVLLDTTESASGPSSAIGEITKQKAKLAKTSKGSDVKLQTSKRSAGRPSPRLRLLAERGVQKIHGKGPKSYILKSSDEEEEN